MNLITRILINIAVIIIVAYLVPGFHVDSLFAALVVVAILGVFNILIKPVLIILTLPINILTLGLFTFVINALLLELTASIVKGFTIESFGSALIGAVLISLINFTINRLDKKPMSV